ncbi:NADH-cytochrome b5 reductase [Thoreauomyces humboldtii]|nr:NADH-cytochrome b5 reductase [Thoreauomyces humboldtii]
MLYRTVARTLSASPIFGGMRMSTTSGAGMGASGAGPTPQGSSGLSTFVKMVLVPGVVTAGAYYLYTQQQADSTQKIKAKLDANAKANPVPALDGKTFIPFALKEIEDMNHNTKRFRFALPQGTTELGLPTASAVVTKMVDGVKADGKPNVVIRPYTPVEDPADGYTGTFDMIIKKYPNGPMSTHIWSLKPGDTLDVKGPIAKHAHKANEYQKITMLAGGTGITPMVQLIQRILSNPEDKTKMTLVFANIAEEDIILRDYFDAVAKKNPGQFEVRYVLEKPPQGWKGETGYISEKLVKEVAPAPGTGKVFVCGPNPMVAAISGTKAKDFSQGQVGGILKKLGYAESDVYKF